MSALAVIVVSFNTRALLAQTLRSLGESLRASELKARVLVVDNASHDGSAEMVRAEFPEVELLLPGENLGFAGGNNLALRELGFPKGGESEGVWLLNSDTEVVGDAPKRLLDHLRRAPGAGAVGPTLRYGDGRFQHGAFALPGIAQLVFDLFPSHPRLLESRLNGRYPARLWAGGRPFRVQMLLGAAMMVRGAAIAEAGLMDEGYFMYAEELDWCRALAREGWALHALPTATVIHHSGQSTRQFREQMVIALWRSRLRYYDKWHSPAYARLVRALLRAGMAVRARRAAPEERRVYRAVAALAGGVERRA